MYCKNAHLMDDFFSYQRKSINGQSIRTWLTQPCKVFVTRHVRNNKFESMFEYENATKDMRVMSVKNIICNFTLKEVEESMFNETASVFEDMSVYERLSDISISISAVMNEDELYSEASNWFKDLTMTQKRDILPYLHVSRGGLETKIIIRMENGFVVNGGVKNESGDEWSTWRRYVTKLVVNYVESLEENDGEVEVIMF